MSSDIDNKTKLPKFPTSEEFSTTIGQVTWLMTMSASHRKRTIDLIEAHVSAPLMFKQVRVFTKGKQPLAALIWAYASDELIERLDDPSYVMTLNDWRSGPTIHIVDCISPFLDSEIFRKRFAADVQSAQDTVNPIKS